MGKIADIRRQQKDPNRFNVYVDGQFAFGISAEIRFEKKLEIDQKLSEKQVEDLINLDQTERLLNKALNFISFRPRSEKEIREHLLRKGKLKEVKGEVEKTQYEFSVGEVLRRLKKLGQINDRTFASWWIDQRNRFRPCGQRLLRIELRAKGVSKEIIDESLCINDEDQMQLALAAASKKMKLLKKYNEEEIRLKIGQFLLRRGFDWNIIKKVVDTLIRKG